MTPTTKRKRAWNPRNYAPNCVLIRWITAAVYTVGPGVENARWRGPDARYHPAYKPSTCRSRLAARQAVARWKTKLSVRLVVGEALLEGR